MEIQDSAWRLLSHKAFPARPSGEERRYALESAMKRISTRNAAGHLNIALIMRAKHAPHSLGRTLLVLLEIGAEALKPKGR